MSTYTYIGSFLLNTYLCMYLDCIAGTLCTECHNYNYKLVTALQVAATLLQPLLESVCMYIIKVVANICENIIQAS